MQTFLPYPDFEETFQCLDYRRLGKQRVEAKQILDILLHRTESTAWRNHPAVRMWCGYENALKLYFNRCCGEWTLRGYTNNMESEAFTSLKLVYPCWLGNEDFHASHRANLLRKDPEFYGQFGWTEDPTLPYIWPV